jgi:hypothetical protein
MISLGGTISMTDASSGFMIAAKKSSEDIRPPPPNSMGDS